MSMIIPSGRKTSLKNQPSALKSTDSKILIIDDDGQFRRALAERLNNEGFHRITQSDSGEEGVEQAADLMPDLIILDTVLPVANGFTVCKKIRSIRGLESAKIIMVSGSVRNIDAARARRAGADVYTLKSSDCACILEAIAGLEIEV